jgi:hypothetical protein
LEREEGRDRAERARHVIEKNHGLACGWIRSASKVQHRDQALRVTPGTDADAEADSPPSIAEGSLNNSKTLISLLKSHATGFSVGFWFASLSRDVMAFAKGVRVNYVCQDSLKGDFHT